MVFVASSARANGHPALYHWDSTQSQYVSVTDQDHPFVVADNEAVLHIQTPASDTIGYAKLEGSFSFYDSVAGTWSSREFWEVTRGNMTWRQRQYFSGAIVYNPVDNKWYVATQDVAATVGSPEEQASAAYWNVVGGGGAGGISLFSGLTNYSAGDLVLVQVGEHYDVYRAEQSIPANTNAPGTHNAPQGWAVVGARPNVFVTSNPGATPANVAGTMTHATESIVYDPPGGVCYAGTFATAHPYKSQVDADADKESYILVSKNAQGWAGGWTSYGRTPDGTLVKWAGGGGPGSQLPDADINAQYYDHILRPASLGGNDDLSTFEGVAIWQGIDDTGADTGDADDLVLAVWDGTTVHFANWTTPWWKLGDIATENTYLLSHAIGFNRRDDVFINDFDRLAWLYDGATWHPINHAPVSAVSIHGIVVETPDPQVPLDFTWAGAITELPNIQPGSYLMIDHIGTDAGNPGAAGNGVEDGKHDLGR